MMSHDHRLIQRQTQNLVLTQRMQQALQILQLSSLELEEHIQQELETNPTIEIDSAPRIEREVALPEESFRNSEDEGAGLVESGVEMDGFADSWDDMPYDSYASTEGTDLSRNPESDERRQHYQDSITGSESLSSRLLTQLRLAAPDEHMLAIGERIIGDMDGRGYFTGSLDEIAIELNEPLASVEQALALIQQFEPTGVGARDVIECLLLQIRVEFPEEPQLAELVSEHLETLERRQIPAIAKAMHVTPERVEELKDMLARLNPWPGHEFSDQPTQYVSPDIVIEKNDETGEYTVELVRNTVPELRISRRYQDMAREKDTPKETRTYLRGKVESARWLIRNIEQRHDTILRIAKAIARVQRDFFEYGQEAIVPLTLQQIADEVGVHEATVSRTTRGKYMLTPQGFFEMKYFFSPGLRTDDGNEQSSKSVQTLIRKFIDEEDKSKPLSDQKLADMLKALGTNVARRTVTKYREGMGILPTNLRRSYQ